MNIPMNSSTRSRDKPTSNNNQPTSSAKRIGIGNPPLSGSTMAMGPPSTRTGNVQDRTKLLCPANKENSTSITATAPKPKTFIIKPQSSNSSVQQDRLDPRKQPQSSRTTLHQDIRKQAPVPTSSKSKDPTATAGPRIYAPAPAVIDLGKDERKDSEDSDTDYDELEGLKIPQPPPKVPGPNGTPPPSLRDYYASFGLKMSTVRALSRQPITNDLWWNTYEPPAGGYTVADLEESSQSPAAPPPTNPFLYRKASQSVERRILRTDERRNAACLEKLSQVLGKDFGGDPVPKISGHSESSVGEMIGDSESSVGDLFGDLGTKAQEFVAVESEAFPEDDEDVSFLLTCTEAAEVEFARQNPKKLKLDLSPSGGGAENVGFVCGPVPETPKSRSSSTGARNRSKGTTLLPEPVAKQLKFPIPPIVVEVGGEGFEDEWGDDGVDQFLSQLPF